MSSNPKQTPLPDLLDQVPEDIVLGIKGDEPVFPSYTNIPIGRMARQAAAELRRLHAENERIGPLAERVLEIKAQRDTLLEALKMVRDADDDSKRDGLPTIPPAARARIEAAIKAVEEGK